MQEIRVRAAGRADREAWLGLRTALWPGDDHGGEIDRLLDQRGDGAWPQAALIAEIGGRAVGLAEVSVRPIAEGCTTFGVGYLEGWYVDSEHRRRGVGRALVEAAEGWARARGCTELASDTEADNEVSRRAHRAVGFEDAGLVRCFRRPIPHRPGRTRHGAGPAPDPVSFSP